MSQTFVLVHSPLVGPYTWKPVGDELERRGQRVIIPSLLPALNQRSNIVTAMAECVREALEQCGADEPVVYVAHSAAGFFSPPMAAALQHPIEATLFVDATLPKNDSSLSGDYSPQALARLRGMAKAGFLPPWSEWFSEDEMKEVIPDAEIRQRFLAEIQPVPLDLFEEKIQFASTWPEKPCGYLRLSEFYKPMAEQARYWGWPLMEIDAEHMHMLVEPLEVVDLILALAKQVCAN